MPQQHTTLVDQSLQKETPQLYVSCFVAVVAEKRQDHHTTRPHWMHCLNDFPAENYSSLVDVTVLMTGDLLTGWELIQLELDIDQAQVMSSPNSNWRTDLFSFRILTLPGQGESSGRRS